MTYLLFEKVNEDQENSMKSSKWYLIFFLFVLGFVNLIASGVSFYGIQEINKSLSIILKQNDSNEHLLQRASDLSHTARLVFEPSFEIYIGGREGDSYSSMIEEVNDSKFMLDEAIKNFENEGRKAGLENFTSEGQLKLIKESALGSYQSSLSVIQHLKSKSLKKAKESFLNSYRKYTITLSRTDYVTSKLRNKQAQLIHQQKSLIDKLGWYQKIILGAFIFSLFGIVFIFKKFNQMEEVLEKEMLNSSHNAKLASIGELAAGVGHEINNPLAIVSGSLRRAKKEFLKNGFKNDLITESFRKQEEGIKRISDIVEGLRTYVRMDTDYNQILNVHELITKTMDFTIELYSKEGIQVKTDLSATECRIKGNTGKFYQVLMVLLSNARDAVEKCEKPEIHVSSESSNDELIIKVKDNGVGILDEIKDKIFESFFTTKEVGKGTGLGLSLAFKFIKEMNGRIDVESELCEGATFTVFFPLTHEEKVSEVHEDLKIEKLSGKALVIEDEKDLREMIVEDLVDLGLEVDEAINGEMGLDAIRKNRYDLVFTDLTMPLMNGVDFIKNARKEEVGDTKFVIITGGLTGKDPVSKEKELDLLADAKLFKPYEINDLIKITSKLIKKV